LCALSTNRRLSATISQTSLDRYAFFHRRMTSLNLRSELTGTGWTDWWAIQAFGWLEWGSSLGCINDPTLASNCTTLEWGTRRTENSRSFAPPPQQAQLRHLLGTPSSLRMTLPGDDTAETALRFRKTLPHVSAKARRNVGHPDYPSPH
jgi:hypothetical protein